MARSITQPGPERTNRLLFMGAVGLAALAAIAIFVVLTSVGGDDDAGGTVGDTTVLVAANDIAAGTVIEEQMLSEATFSESTIIEGSVVNSEDIVGKRIATPLLANQQYSTSLLVDANNKFEDLSVIIEPPNVGFPLDADETLVFGGLLVPGNHVDVLAILPSAIEGEAPRGLRIVQNVRVVSVGDQPQDPGSTTPNEDEAAQPDARTITLEVAPGDDLLIALAQSEGEIALSVRALGNDDVDPNPPVIVLPQ
jgi:pilus assembly protein CpaB